MIAHGTKVGDALRQLAGRLAEAGIDEARLDARLLLQAATGLSTEQLVLEPARALSANEAARVDDLAERRRAREPVSRILGERSFYGRTFAVTADTLDPRPDTETLVALGLEIVRQLPRRERGVRILDVGTGTGCVLLTLLAEIEGTTGVGTGVSEAALAVERGNAALHGLGRRATWQNARGLDAVEAPFDLVVSNPPYIPTTDIQALEPEVRLFDPELALDGGEDGLAVIQEIVAASALGVSGADAWFALELGAGQMDAVAALIAAHCGPAAAATIAYRLDLGGHTRCVAWLPQSKGPHESLLAREPGGAT